MKSPATGPATETGRFHWDGARSTVGMASDRLTFFAAFLALFAGGRGGEAARQVARISLAEGHSRSFAGDGGGKGEGLSSRLSSMTGANEMFAVRRSLSTCGISGSELSGSATAGKTDNEECFGRDERGFGTGIVWFSFRERNAYF